MTNQMMVKPNANWAKIPSDPVLTVSMTARPSKHLCARSALATFPRHRTTRLVARSAERELRRSAAIVV